jgi:predicted RecA/RadA family phage recombinase
MKNQVQQGNSIYVVAPVGGFTSGNAYLIGAALFGIAGFSCAAGAVGVLWLQGVYSLPKLSTDVFAPGDLAYWDDVNGWVTVTAGLGIHRIGIATSTAGSPSAFVDVRLDGCTGARQ